MSAPGENCSAGCITRDHDSFGACMRAKNTRVAYCQSVIGHDATRQKKWDNDLAAYRDARRQGVQPAGTGRDSVDRAMKISEQTGVAYQA